MFRIQKFRKFILRHHFSDAAAIIAAAARTPISSLKPLKPAQLGALAIEAVIKQSTLPKDSVHAVVCMGHNVQHGEVERASILAGLPKSICCYTVDEHNVHGLNALTLAIKMVQSEQAQIVVVGGIDCGQKDNAAENENEDEATQKSFQLAWKQGTYASQILAVRIQERHKPAVIITEDAAVRKSLEAEKTINYCDGAAALMLTTNTVASNYELTPLARILSYQEEDTEVEVTAIKSLLERSGTSATDIDMWALCKPTAFKKNFPSVDISKVNTYGCSVPFPASLGISGICLVTHLTHTLLPGQIGCAAICSSCSSAAILIEKIKHTASSLPLLTLYTKDPCPLCDELLAELEDQFSGQYQLEKIFITQKEHLRFLRLFRNDIPVLFLNGQYLCEHSLNSNLLRYKLEKIKAS